MAIAVMPLEKVSDASASSQILQPVLENFLVGAVEARIDQALGLAARACLSVMPSKKRLPSAAVSNTKVEVRKIGGFSEPSLSAGSKP